jgi:hypothetical protein
MGTIFGKSPLIKNLKWLTNSKPSDNLTKANNFPRFQTSSLLHCLCPQVQLTTQSPSRCKWEQDCHRQWRCIFRVVGVGMESVCLGFLLAKINGLKVCAANISSTFLYSKTWKRWYIIAGPEFGVLEGEKLVICKGLYALWT